jgi:hypothetical protein
MQPVLPTRSACHSPRFYTSNTMEAKFKQFVELFSDYPTSQKDLSIKDDKDTEDPNGKFAIGSDVLVINSLRET